MAGSTLRDAIPPVYGRLLGPLFDAPAIPEPRATCDDCAMCDKGPAAGAVAGDTFFSPDLKCCTYHPTLPNFLVGALFADADPALDEGRRRVRAAIARRAGVSPEWVGPPRKYRVLLEAGRVRGFGRARALVCPYLDSGRCSIWRHRESVCSTFYCKYAGGAKGKAFWMAQKHVMAGVEAALARWAARAVDPGLREPEVPLLELTAEDLDDLPPRDAEYAACFGAWVGREEELYVACHERVAAMTRDEFASVIEAAEPVASRLVELGVHHQALAQPSPTPLLVLSPRLRPTKVDGGYAVRPYSSYDALVISDDLHAVLSELRPDVPAAETFARLEREHGVVMPPELLLELWNHEILVPPEAPGPASPDPASPVGARGT
jgi:Fe-S-cluster containining protein